MFDKQKAKARACTDKMQNRNHQDFLILKMFQVTCHLDFKDFILVNRIDKREELRGLGFSKTSQ